MWDHRLIEGFSTISYWQNELSIPSLIKHEPSPQPTSLSFVRTGLDGRVTGYTEVPFPALSLSLNGDS